MRTNVIKFEPTEPIVLNYDNLYIMPDNSAELDDIIHSSNSTSMRPSKSELVKMIETIFDTKKH